MKISFKKNKTLFSFIICLLVLLLVIFIMKSISKNNYACNLIVNHQEYNMGEVKKCYIKIPSDMVEVETEEGAGKNKQYATFEEMEKELGITILKPSVSFKTLNEENDKGLFLQIMEDKKGTIFYFLENADASKLIMPDMINIQFFLDKGNTVENVIFENQTFEDNWETEEGKAYSVITDSTYEMLDSYVYDKLGTTVFLVKNSEKTTEIKEGKNEETGIQEIYYVQFLYDGMIYQLQWHEEVTEEQIKEFIETMEL